MVEMLDLEKQFSFYGAYHNNKVNIFIHTLFVWPIFSTSLILWAYTPAIAPLPLAAGTLPFQQYMVLNFSFFQAAFYGLYYIALDKKAGSLSALICMGCWIGANAVAQTLPWSLSWKIVLASQVTCWFFQVFGHLKFEGRAPALLDNLPQAFLMAPFFVLLEFLLLFGYEPYPGFQEKVQKNVDEAIREFNASKGKKVLQMYSPLALRWFLIGTHYRFPVNYSKRQLESASDGVYYLYQALADCEQALVETTTAQSASKEAMDCVKKLTTTYGVAMADDLLTPVVIASLSEPLKIMNDILHIKKGRKDKSRLASLSVLKAEVEGILDVLGLTVPSYIEVLQGIKRLALKRAGLSEEELISRVQERAAARAAKEYERSDNIRKDLAAIGIALMDGGDGTQRRPAAADDQL